MSYGVINEGATMNLATSAHTRTAFDADLQGLVRMAAEMGGLAERQILQSIEALAQKNVDLARQVIDDDAALDAFQTKIEKKGIEIIAQHQPLAGDLRETVSALHICSDLERIGDLAKNISKRTIAIENAILPISLIVGIDHMAQMVMQQLKLALDSYASRNVSGARAVRDGDLEIDVLNNALFHETLAHMSADTDNMAVGTHMLFCIKNLERIGDHATNIAEAVDYIVSGRLPAGERPKGNTANFAA